MFGVETIVLLAGAPLRFFIMFFEGFFKGLVNMIVTPAVDYCGNKERDVKVKEHQKNEKNEEKADVFASLFPRRHNVEESLLDHASVTPCSLDISMADSSMKMSMTDGGQFQCKLNTDESLAVPSNNKYNNMLVTSPPNIDLKGLPISPESNTSCTPIKSEDEGSRASTVNPIGQLPSRIIKSEVSDEVDREGLFVCHYCDAKFKIRGYLTRHIKKHAIQKAYHCPFFMGDVPPELRCHNSGGFSRRDTYKTHLRTRHFIYPKGIKPSERSKSSGSCGQCGKNFENTDKWVEQHIESGECKGLPPDYVRNIKSERKSGKLKMIKTSTGHSRFISTAQSVVEPEVLLNKEALEAMAIVAHNTNRSDILSRYGNNKILMISANFKGESKPKKKYSKKRGFGKNSSDKNLAGWKPQPLSSSSSSDVTTPSTLPPLEDSPMATNPYASQLDNAPLCMDSAILLSIEQNQSSESIAPILSSSSHEDHKSNTNINSNPSMNNEINNSSIMFNDPFSVPLDIEQSPVFGPADYDEVKNSDASGRISQRIAINETLQRQMDVATLGDSQLNQVEQYTNFYKHNFGYNV